MASPGGVITGGADRPDVPFPGPGKGGRAEPRGGDPGAWVARFAAPAAPLEPGALLVPFVPFAGPFGCGDQLPGPPAVPGARAAAATAGGSQESVNSPRFPEDRDRQDSMIPAGVGRSAGSLARHRSISVRSAPEQPVSRGGSFSTRYISAATWPSPKGGRPSSAKAPTAPSANTSMAGVMARPRICSGAMNCGEPTAMPLWVRLVASAARAMPKSMTRGPSGASSTLDGLRSRCTTPAE